MKKILALAICAACLLALAACGGDNNAPAAASQGTGDASQSTGDASQPASQGGGLLESIGNAIGDLISGDSDVTGQVGNAYHTQWFAFKVASIERTATHAGYTAAEGNELVVVDITERNIFDEVIPMGTYDFYLDSDTFMDYEWPMDPLDDNMMPENFDLAPEEEVNYTMVYEVPAGLTDLVLCYTEQNEAEEIGATFTIPVPN